VHRLANNVARSDPVMGGVSALGGGGRRQRRTRPGSVLGRAEEGAERVRCADGPESKSNEKAEAFNRAIPRPGLENGADPAAERITNDLR
jgi:hypothetical protein